MKRAASASLTVLFATGCMTYDFEPVVPFAIAQTTQDFTVTARRLKPNLMLLVDKSGSMLAPIDPQNPNCPPGCGSGSTCPATCPTRISELRDAMSSLLTQSGADARMGLTFFPAGLLCEPASSVDVAFPPPTADDTGADPALRMTSSTINGRIQAIVPTGGTPTAASLQFAGQQPGLNDPEDNRQDFLLLLTDGLPNCNEANPRQVCTCDQAVCSTCQGGACQAQQDACKCTLNSCGGQNCARGCLDQQAVVDVTKANELKGIKTIVVGFGADTATGDAPEVLNAIAEAGAFPRSCPRGTDAECGANNRCQANGVCERKFYQAADSAELSQALRAIFDLFKVDICDLTLPAQPERPEYLSVIVDGEVVLPGPDTWTYVAPNVKFTGAICEKIKASTTVNPVKVQFRILETL